MNPNDPMSIAEKRETGAAPKSHQFSSLNRVVTCIFSAVASPLFGFTLAMFFAVMTITQLGEVHRGEYGFPNLRFLASAFGTVAFGAYGLVARAVNRDIHRGGANH